MSGPLKGIRGVVLTQAWAGSYCTELFAMAGADIVQLEVRKRPDSWRGTYTAPMSEAMNKISTAKHVWNINSNFNAVNLGKRSFTLDLSRNEGVDIFKSLIKHADFVAENFSPRVMGNLGFSYEELCEIKPDIILASLSAYGHDGPWCNVPGIGGTIEPTSGMSALLGYGDGVPINSGVMYPDAVAGLYGFSGLLTALHYRNRTGKGQFVDLSMQEANLANIGEAALEYTYTKQVPNAIGNRHKIYAPHGIFPCADGIEGDKKWVAIAAETDVQWMTLCEISGMPWVSNSKFTSNVLRKENEEELNQEISFWTREQDRDVLSDLLSSKEVIAAPVLNAKEVLNDRVLRSRGVIVELDHPEVGKKPQIGAPFHFSQDKISVVRPSPLQGQHSFEIFSELLGMDRDEYEKLVAENISGEGPPK